MADARADGRQSKALRPLSIEAGINPYADGSAGVSFGSTRLLIAAELEENGSGLVHVSLSMLPLATRLRLTDATIELPKEIELIEKIASQTLTASLEAANVDSLDVSLFVSVCVADGGVAAATVAGGWVAMYQCLSTAAVDGKLLQDLDLPRVASLSAGIVDDEMRIDLLSEETTKASFHLVVSSSVLGGIVGVHAEGITLTTNTEALQELTELCMSSMQEVFDAQENAVT